MSHSKVLHSSSLTQKNARLWDLGKKENLKELMAARLRWALVWVSQGWVGEITSTNPRVTVLEGPAMCGDRAGGPELSGDTSPPKPAPFGDPTA